MRRAALPDQPRLALSEPYENRGLFAAHFLKERLSELPEWSAPGGLETAFKAIQELYRNKGTRLGSNINEAQTERDFVQPVLDILWQRECYQVQVSIPNLDARRQPDYAFFRTPPDREAFVPAPDGTTFLEPAYNGGLCSASTHPEIAPTEQPGARRWQIGDHRLAQVIDMLAYQRERWNEPGSQDIDYKTLQVQHLGSIYEGLLELQTHLAAQPLVEVVEDGKPLFKPQSEVPNPRPVRGQEPRRIGKDEIYLVTNRVRKRQSAL